MKQMQNFHKWLSYVEGATAIQRRLAALKSLNRNQLSEAAFEPWFLWAAAEPGNV